MSAVSSRLGYQVLALNPGRSKKFATDRKTETQTHSIVYRVAPQLKTSSEKISFKQKLSMKWVLKSYTEQNSKETSFKQICPKKIL